MELETPSTEKKLVICVAAVLAAALVLVGFLYVKERKTSADAAAQTQELNSLVASLSQDLEDKTTQIDALNASLQEKDSEIGKLNTDLENRNSEIDTLNADLESKASEIDTLNADLESKDSRITDLTARSLTYLETVRDEDGNLLRQPNFRSDGSVGYTLFSREADTLRQEEYDLQDNLLEYTLIQYRGDTVAERCTYDADGTLRTRITNTLDDQGRIIRSDTCYVDQDRTHYSLYSNFDSDGNALREENYIADGTLDSSVDCIYGPFGLTEQRPYNASGMPLYTLAYEYDDTGCQKAFRMLNSSGKPIYVSYSDALGRQSATESYNDDGQLFRTTASEYDSRGFRSRMFEYSASGKLTQTSNYTYSDLGFLVSALCTSPDGTVISTTSFHENGEMAVNITYSGTQMTSRTQYDEAARPIRTEYYSDGALTSRSERQYDAFGALICSDNYSADGMLSMHTEYEDGNTQRTQYYDSTGELTETRSLRYDDNGYLLESRSYQSDGTLTSVESFERDQNGTLLHSATRTAGGILTHEERFLNGKPSSTRYYNDDGSLYRSYSFAYDEAGRCIRQNSYDSQNTLDNYILYEYDADGNPTPHFYHSDGTPFTP